MNERAINEVAKLIKSIDNNSLLFEYVGKEKAHINNARALLYGVISDNGYFLSDNYKPLKIK